MPKTPARFLGRIFRALPLRHRAQLLATWHAGLHESLNRNTMAIIRCQLTAHDKTPHQVHAELADLQARRARMEKWHADTIAAQEKTAVLIEVENITREAASN